MKRFVLAALILGSILACTKSNIQYGPTGEISLQPVTEKTTKAAFTANAYGEGAPAFNVWAWWADVEPATSLAKFLGAGASEFIRQGEFVHRGGGSWGGSTPYYWPTEGSLVFAGYSPSVTSGGTFAYNKDSRSFSAQGYVQSDDIAHTVDLMWFDITDKSYNGNKNMNSLGEEVSGVPVVFHHALSWLKFGFKLTEKAGIPQNWRITNVTLTGIYTKANFFSTPVPAWRGHSVEKKEIQVWSGTHLVSTTAEVLESTADGVVVIPQDCSAGAANLVVTYDLKKYLGDGSDQWLRAQTVTLPLNAGTDGGAWKPGKKYIYTIVFGDNEIRIVPVVEQWTDQPDIEIEVQ